MNIMHLYADMYYIISYQEEKDVYYMDVCCCSNRIGTTAHSTALYQIWVINASF